MCRTFLYDGTFDDDDDDDDDCWTVVFMIYVLLELYIECINKKILVLLLMMIKTSVYQM